MLQMQSSAHGAALCCRTLPAGAAFHLSAGGSADAALSVDRQDHSPTDAQSATKTKSEINNCVDFVKAVGWMGYVVCGVIPCGVTKEIAKMTASAALQTVLPRSSESC